MSLLGEAIWLLLETEFAPSGIRGVGMIILVRTTLNEVQYLPT